MDPFVGEIRIFGFPFAPKGWAFCAGQVIPITQNTALFALLGTSFGGNGTTNFGLPNLQGNVGINQGQAPGLSSYTLGETAGVTSVTLSTNQLAPHNHTLNANTGNGTGLAANGNVLATLAPAGRSGGGANGKLYSTNAGAATTALDQRSIGAAGSGGAHNNIQPSMAMNFCIALQGVFPPRQ